MINHQAIGLISKLLHHSSHKIVIGALTTLHFLTGTETKREIYSIENCAIVKVLQKSDNVRLKNISLLFLNDKDTDATA